LSLLTELDSHTSWPRSSLKTMSFLLRRSITGTTRFLSASRYVSTTSPNTYYISHCLLLSQNQIPTFPSNLSFMREISTFSSSKDKKQQDGELSMGGKVSWVDVYLPRQVRPYAHLARIDKQIGTWLLAWPTMW